MSKRKIIFICVIVILIIAISLGLGLYFTKGASQNNNNNNNENENDEGTTTNNDLSLEEVKTALEVVSNAFKPYAKEVNTSNVVLANQLSSVNTPSIYNSLFVDSSKYKINKTIFNNFEPENIAEIQNIFAYYSIIHALSKTATSTNGVFNFINNELTKYPTPIKLITKNNEIMFSFNGVLYNNNEIITTKITFDKQTNAFNLKIFYKTKTNETSSAEITAIFEYNYNQKFLNYTKIVYIPNDLTALITISHDDIENNKMATITNETELTSSEKYNIEKVVKQISSTFELPTSDLNKYNLDATIFNEHFADYINSNLTINEVKNAINNVSSVFKAYLTDEKLLNSENEENDETVKLGSIYDGIFTDDSKYKTSKTNSNDLEITTKQTIKDLIEHFAIIYATGQTITSNNALYNFILSDGNASTTSMEVLTNGNTIKIKINDCTNTTFYKIIYDKNSNAFNLLIYFKAETLEVAYEFCYDEKMLSHTEINVDKEQKPFTVNLLRDDVENGTITKLSGLLAESEECINTNAKLTEIGESFVFPKENIRKLTLDESEFENFGYEFMSN